MGDEEILKIFENLDGLLAPNNFLFNGLRLLGWGIVLFLRSIVNVLDKAVRSTYKLVDFVNSSVIGDNISGMGAIVIAMMAISICILGYKIIFKRQNKNNMFVGSLLVIVITMALPVIFNQGIKLTTAMSNGMTIEKTVADELIRLNVHDLYKYGKYNNFALPENEQFPNNLSYSQYIYMDLGETLSDKKIENKQGDIVKKQRVLDSDGKVKPEAFEKNNLMGKTGYYRYSIEWFTIISSLLITGVTLFLTGVKIVKIIFNLSLDRIIGTILIFSDLEEGNRAKELLKHIIATFAVLMASSFSITLYTRFVSWIATKDNIIGSGLQGTVTNIIILLGVSLALIEGPTIIQKLLGTQVDGGLSRTAAGMFGLGKMASPITKPMGKSLANGFSKGKALGTKIFGDNKASEKGEKLGNEDKDKTSSNKDGNYGNISDSMSSKNSNNSSSNNSKSGISSNPTGNTNQNGSSSDDKSSIDSGIKESSSNELNGIDTAKDNTDSGNSIDKGMESSGFNNSNDGSNLIGSEIGSNIANMNTPNINNNTDIDDFHSQLNKVGGNSKNTIKSEKIPFVNEKVKLNDSGYSNIPRNVTGQGRDKGGKL